ncbi:hypothetical protein Gpo141_00013600 [Globisporangium polare]
MQTAASKSAQRVAWSAAEDAALLRAWEDVVERRVKGLLKAFEAQCAAASVPAARSANSIQLRRGLSVRMYEIVCAFHKCRQQQQKATVGGDDDGGMSCHSTADDAEYSSDNWFELSPEEQRRWFASLNTGTYSFGEMTREVFDHVESLLKRKDTRSSTGRAAPYTLPRKEKKTAATDADGLRASIALLKRTTRRARDGDSTAVTSHHHEIASVYKEEAMNGDDRVAEKSAAAMNENGSSDGSSTESDDEILAWWGGAGGDADRRPVEAEPGSETKRPVVKAPSKEVKPVQCSEQQEVSTQLLKGGVDADFLELVGCLETQARHLGDLFRQTKMKRTEESRGRRYIVGKIGLGQSEINKVAGDITRREHELQKEREEWEDERRAVKRELARLREGGGNPVR